MFLGVEQKSSDYVTDGLELQKVIDPSVRRTTPTSASPLSDEERDLQSAPATGLEDSSSDAWEGESRSDVVKDSTEAGRQVLETDKNDVESEKLSSSKKRTPVNDRGSKNRDDVRLNRNYELKERLNIDSDGNVDQNQASRDLVAKIGEKKLAEPAEAGRTAEFESLNAGTTFSAVPDSNLSSTPSPFILKVKNTPARAELDDIYFLCEYFLLFFHLAEIK